MPKLVTQEMTQRSESGYTSTAMTVEVPDHDTDIMVKLPNGLYMELQWRPEGQSVDVCMDEHTTVMNWADDMKPAPAVKGTKDCYRAVQLVIDMGIPKKKKGKKR